MVHFIEFLMPMIVTEEEYMLAKKNSGQHEIHIEALPGDQLNKAGLRLLKPFAKQEEQLKIFKVSVLTPCLLHGDPVKFLEPNECSRTIPELKNKLADLFRLPESRIPNIEKCRVTKVVVGTGIFTGNNHTYIDQEDFPVEVLLYKSHNKYVYYFEEGLPFYPFTGASQGKKVYRVATAEKLKDFRTFIRAEEGILLLLFDVTQEQMTEQSQNQLMGEILTPDFCEKIMKDWSDKLQFRLPYFSSVEEIADEIQATNMPKRSKYRLSSFMVDFIELGLKQCREKYSPASFVRNYTDLKKALGVGAILLEKHNRGSKSYFLERYRRPSHDNVVER